MVSTAVPKFLITVREETEFDPWHAKFQRIKLETHTNYSLVPKIAEVTKWKSLLNLILF